MFSGKTFMSCSKVQLDVLTETADTLNKSKTQTTFGRIFKTKCDYFQYDCSNYLESCLLTRLRVVPDLVFGLIIAFHTLTNPFCEGILKT